MEAIQFVFGVLLSAATLSLAIPNELLPSGSALLGLIALVPLYRSLLASRGWRAAGFAGGLMMALVHLFSSFWLAYFKEFAIFTLGASTLAYFLFGTLAGWLFRWSLLRPKWARPFLFAAMWTLWEWFKSTGFLAYPWGTLVMASRGLPALIQIADVTGAWGISFLLALLNAVVAETTLLRPSRARAFLSGRVGFGKIASLTGARTLAFTAFVFALALGYGTWRLAFPPVPETILAVAMIQHDADPWDVNEETPVLESERLTREAIAARGSKPDLVVWSESTLPWPWEQYRNYYRRYPDADPVGPFLEEIGVPLVSGAPVLVDPERKGYSNSVVYLSPKGEVLGWYAKTQLVPFAEYMPFTEYEWVAKFFDVLVGFSSGWVPGTEYKSFPVKNSEGTEIRFAAPLCFEDAFSPVVAGLHATGSDLLVNLTNDSWSETDSAEMQHFTVASFRAIELRTTLIRSTNAGYTCVIDPTGRVLADLPLFESGYLNADVPVYPHLATLYARFGDWFPKSLALLILATFALPGFRRLRARFAPGEVQPPYDAPAGSGPTRFHWQTGDGGSDATGPDRQAGDFGAEVEPDDESLAELEPVDADEIVR